MTTVTHPSDAGARPDVRAETHSHRHPAKGLPLRNPAWLLFLLVTFVICVGGLFAVAWTLGGAAYTATPTT